MKIIGLTRVRNESHIILETLNRWSAFCDFILVYDDCSTDNTVDLCRSHPKVVTVIQGEAWDSNRARAEYENRQQVLELGQTLAQKDDWFVYFDADEHPYEFTDFNLFNNPRVSGIRMRLYDVHITPEDVNKSYLERQWVCPRSRVITFFFRNLPGLKYHIPDQRQIVIPNKDCVVHGTIKHFGKGFSVKQWEETCNYYAEHFPMYSKKWAARRGKAVKEDMCNDWGEPLVRWEDVRKS